jgi:hypothetical protein
MKEKGKVIGRQVGSKKVSKSLHVHNWLHVVGWPYLYVKKIDNLQ